MKASRSLLLISFGLALVILALVKGAWLPDYQNRNPGHTVAHYERLLGLDKPTGKDAVERRTGYIFFRLFDALIYLALAQILVGVVAVIKTDDHFFWLMLAGAGFYGMLYSAISGLVIGPQMAFIGFCCIFLAAGLEWLVTRNLTRTDDESYSAA